MFSSSHLILLLVIALILIWGPAKLPQLGRGLGDAIRGFKKGMSGEDENEIDVTNSSSEKLTEAEWREKQAAKEREKNKA